MSGFDAVWGLLLVVAAWALGTSLNPLHFKDKYRKRPGKKNIEDKKRVPRFWDF